MSMDKALAKTADYLVTYEGPLFSILRRSDEKQLVLSSRHGAVGEFRDCVRTHGAERTIETFIRLAEYNGQAWGPSGFKPGVIQRRLMNE